MNKKTILVLLILLLIATPMLICAKENVECYKENKCGQKGNCHSFGCDNNVMKGNHFVKDCNMPVNPLDDKEVIATGFYWGD